MINMNDINHSVYQSMVKLRDLDANFLKYLGNGSHQWKDVGREEADGIMFLCPKCFKDNNGPVGTHSVICWFVGRVPDDVDPKPGRWNPSGTSIDDFSLVGPGAHSILMLGGCGWHGFVTNGDAS